MRKSTESSDEVLARETQSGDTGAYALLVGRYMPKLIRYASRFLKRAEDAEDVVQEVFLKAYQSINQFDSTRKFSSWIYRITHNECVNTIRKSSKEAIPFFDPDEIFPHPVSSDQPETDSERLEVRRVLDASLNLLSLKYREVLLLYYYEELSYDEIADVLHIPVSTVGVRISRAKLALRKQLQKDNCFSS